MNKIKDRLNRLKNKYGLTLPLAGILTMGSIGYNPAVKDNNVSDKIENTNKGREMTEQEKSDGFLMSVLVMLEGLSLKAYLDAVKVATYGAGSTKTIEGLPVKIGDTLKDNEEAFLTANHHIEKEVDFVFDYIKRDLTPEQKAALRSFAYNCGAGTLVKKGELTKLGKAVNEGRDDFVIKEMLTYNRGGGSFLRGLFFRRVLEAYIYQGFVSMKDIQNCIIGGIGNVSNSSEMKKIFNLKETRRKVRGKKLKVNATFSDAAITDSNVAKKMLQICQIPATYKPTGRYAECHIGEQISGFLPDYLVPDKLPQASNNDFATAKKDILCEPNTLKLPDNKQIAGTGSNLRNLLRKIRSSRSSR